MGEDEVGYSDGIWLEISAGTPRALIYYEGPTEHRAVVFGEADSIPGLGSSASLDASEDNPAASAIRALLQDNKMKYSLAVQRPNGQGYQTRHIVKHGPTVLITTSVRPLGPQLMTRFFTLDIPGGDDQNNAALDQIVKTHDAAPADPPDALIAYQDYLQRLAPWDVHIPFLKHIRDGLPRQKVPTRLLRDLQKIISFVQAVTILRHRKREKDSQGRLVATVEDYAAIYELVNEIYIESVTGITDNIKTIIAAVKELKASDPNTTIGYSTLEKHVGLHRQQITRDVNKAVEHGWLVDNQTKKRSPRDIVLGEEVPSDQALPSPESICHSVTGSTADDQGHWEA